VPLNVGLRQMHSAIRQLDELQYGASDVMPFELPRGPAKVSSLPLSSGPLAFQADGGRKASIPRTQGSNGARWFGGRTLKRDGSKSNRNRTLVGCVHRIYRGGRTPPIAKGATHLVVPGRIMLIGCPICSPQYPILRRGHAYTAFLIAHTLHDDCNAICWGCFGADASMRGGVPR
jgi:hypothetical protein